KTTGNEREYERTFDSSFSKILMMGSFWRMGSRGRIRLGTVTPVSVVGTACDRRFPCWRIAPGVLPRGSALRLGGGFGGHLEGADAHQMLVVMTPLEVAFAFKEHVSPGGRIVSARPGFEQPPGSVVARRDGGVQITHVATLGPLEDVVEHAGSQALATGFLGHSHLPYE